MLTIIKKIIYFLLIISLIILISILGIKIGYEKNIFNKKEVVVTHEENTKISKSNTNLNNIYTSFDFENINKDFFLNNINLEKLNLNIDEEVNNDITKYTITEKDDKLNNMILSYDNTINRFINIQYNIENGIFVVIFKLEDNKISYQVKMNEIKDFKTKNEQIKYLKEYSIF